ncbi:MAG: hypothetical protein KCHDKBKB_01803 [Elusimicrobia bacterium]|nr:hypothetical protein [Elusimicrobiota bacterium]
MFHNESEVNKALSALGDQFADKNQVHIDLVVCGGSALNALGLVSRTTKDVDVLALVKHLSIEKLVLQSAHPLPDPLLKAAEKVERDFGLPKGWINSGPSSMLKFGLPLGLLERCETRQYGPALTIRFLSRYDQIHFKLYAAVDQGGKHYEDLLALKPLAHEIEAAARWTITHDPSEPFKTQLKSLINHMGFINVANAI